MQRSVVLLPAPLTPMKPVTVPAGTEKETSLMPPPPRKCLARPETVKRSAGAPGGMAGLNPGPVYILLTPLIGWFQGKQACAWSDTVVL